MIPELPPFPTPTKENLVTTKLTMHQSNVIKDSCSPITSQLFLKSRACINPSPPPTKFRDLFCHLRHPLKVTSMGSNGAFFPIRFTYQQVYCFIGYGITPAQILLTPKPPNGIFWNNIDRFQGWSHLTFLVRLSQVYFFMGQGVKPINFRHK